MDMDKNGNTILHQTHISGLTAGVVPVTTNESVVWKPTTLAPPEDHMPLKRLSDTLGNGPFLVKGIILASTQQVILSIEVGEGVLTDINQRYLAKP